MDDLEEAQRLMKLVAGQAPAVGPIEVSIVLSMAKVWAHIALAEATRTQNALLERIANTLEERNS